MTMWWNLEHFTDEEFDYLEADSRRVAEARGWNESQRERYIEGLISLRVELKPGGRAVIQPPAPAAELPEGARRYLEGLNTYLGRPTYRVEVQWVFDRQRGVNVAKSALIVAEDELVSGEVDLAPYLAAFMLRVALHEKPGTTRAPRKRPRPGRGALDTDFYRRVLELHRHLLREGHKAPGAEIARRMGENPATVRSWLKRARDLERGTT